MDPSLDGPKEGVGLDASLSWMRAAGEMTRLRLLYLLDRLDLTVSDLMEILNQSQPRLSRHLKLLVDAGLAERSREGAWAYFSTVNSGAARAFLDAILQPLNEQDPTFAADLRVLEAVRAKRQKRASDYFAANAENWDRIRALHIGEDDVEAAMLDMGLSAAPRSLLDLGTGTGRILELFAPHVARGVGLDSSRDMLAVARAALANRQHPHMQVRQGDAYALEGVGRFDLVVLHQVLHFLEEPDLALRQAASCLNADGRLLIVDFAPHGIEDLRERHAHRRLGMSDQQMAQWFDEVGLQQFDERALVPQQTTVDGEALTVRLWLAGLSA
ncbi:MAG: metalloregulator ArsR/SmtB family transcription factor [Pseudomonadota bacterium]